MIPSPSPPARLLDAFLPVDRQWGRFPGRRRAPGAAGPRRFAFGAEM